MELLTTQELITFLREFDFQSQPIVYRGEVTDQVLWTSGIISDNDDLSMDTGGFITSPNHSPTEADLNRLSTFLGMSVAAVVGHARSRNYFTVAEEIFNFNKSRIPEGEHEDAFYDILESLVIPEYLLREMVTTHDDPDNTIAEWVGEIMDEIDDPHESYVINHADKEMAQDKINSIIFSSACNLSVEPLITTDTFTSYIADNFCMYTVDYFLHVIDRPQRYLWESIHAKILKIRPKTKSL